MTRMLCITGTGTGVGKTLVTAALAHQLLAADRRALALKPVISGWDESDGSDTRQLLAAQGMEATPDAVARISPWRFADPLSPHIAAARAGKRVSAGDVAAHCREQAAGADILLVEGAGGVMAPLNGRETFLDVIRLLDAETVLVAGSYLGALSHALTALEALASRGIRPSLLVVSESEISPMPVSETVSSLQGFAPGLPILTVPRLPLETRRWRFAPELVTSLKT